MPKGFPGSGQLRQRTAELSPGLGNMAAEARGERITETRAGMRQEGSAASHEPW